MSFRDLVLLSEVCIICLEDNANNPQACKFCKQCVGCRQCVIAWFNGKELNHKMCPLCRHQWRGKLPSIIKWNKRR